MVCEFVGNVCGFLNRHRIFENNVRYISLLDGIDTFLDSTNNDIAPFRSIINDMQSKDTSKKIRSVLRNKKEQGKFLAKVAPYGYQKDPNDKHKLIIDPEAAEVVRIIFKRYLSGYGINTIAKYLTEHKYLTPMNHKLAKGIRYFNPA